MHALYNVFKLHKIIMIYFDDCWSSNLVSILSDDTDHTERYIKGFNVRHYYTDHTERYIKGFNVRYYYTDHTERYIKGFNV